jgi:tetratricopeptide (TPR) repeat protein
VIVLTVILTALLVVSQAAVQDKAPAALAEAAALFEKNENEKALAAYERAIAADPGNADAHIGRGRTLARLRRYDEALASYGDALKSRPEDAMALRYRGHNYINVRKIDLALADLSRAARLAESAGGRDPRISDVYGIYYHLGLALYLQRDFTGAAAAYEKCVGVSKTDSDRIGCLTWQYPSLRRAGRDAEAQKVLERVNPQMDAGESAAYLDRLLLFKGQRTEQEAAARMSESPLQTSTAGYSIGLWHLLNGRADRAREYFVKASSTDVPFAFGYIAAATELAADATRPELADIWDREHLALPPPPLVDHSEVLKRLDALRAAPDLFRVEAVGTSIEGRSISLVTVGAGSFKVLLWSQMHGDEPTATSALFDVFEYLRKHRSEPMARSILEKLTVYAVPMLNPDGAERFQRRNAQGIDINRDALRLQTPEGRLLKSLRDRLQPRIGFNLHNQNWRTSVGQPPRPASISLLSVAFDEARSDSEGRQLTKRTCAVIRDAIEPLAPGQIGRYEDDFEVRAFGDNLTLWGTPVVLIETGPWPGGQGSAALVRLNFVAILSALDALATGKVHEADPDRYESLPHNDSGMFYILIRNASVLPGTGIAPFTADIGIVASRRVRTVDGKREIHIPLGIEDLGDLRVASGLEEIDASGLTVAPLFDDALKAGAEVSLPDEFTSKEQKRTIAVGEPAALVLLKPLARPDRFVVQRVIKAN